MRQLVRSAALVLTLASAGVAAPLAFRVTLAKSAGERTLDGRVFLFLSQRGGEPRLGPDWFHTEPFFRTAICRLAPGGSVDVDDAADGYPGELSATAPGKYRVQALLDHDFYSPFPGRGAGNVYSQVVEVEVTETGVATAPIELTLERLVVEPPFPDSQWVKEVVLPSKLLAAVFGREVLERAAVVLPASYFDQPQRRYPAVYIIPGFGGSHREGLPYLSAPPPAAEDEEEFIRVYLSGQCKWGHHVYADSATNGPRGAALIEELIPLVDRTYRTVPARTARFVTGHSSGGWSSLWLQVTYPDVFGGVWSSSPDPVDFRDYQRVDLYAAPPLSMYVDERGAPRPLARQGTEPVLFYREFTRVDDVLERGGQLRSFEAAFSPLGPDGLPRKLYDRASGQVDPAVAAAWRAYDIRLAIERDWPRLEPLLRGRVHITTGELDTFYLEGAVVRLAQSLKALGSDAEVTVVPGANHGSLLTGDYFRKLRREMSASYRRDHGGR